MDNVEDVMKKKNGIYSCLFIFHIYFPKIDDVKCIDVYFLKGLFKFRLTFLK